MILHLSSLQSSSCSVNSLTRLPGISVGAGGALGSREEQHPRLQAVGSDAVMSQETEGI